ncbi:MAG: rhodanese-like domain-containing protein [Bacteroidales bacterium]|nr:rhodanese-like domain-containing protein [Bacteroidales bacterium]
MKNNQLFNSSLIFFAIIFGALIFSIVTNKIKGYKINNHDALSQIKDIDDLSLNYLQLQIALNEENGLTFVDLRNTDKFQSGHLNNAVNIPLSNLIDKKNLNFFKKNNVILYSDTENESALALLLLKSLGISNIKYLTGSYEIFSENQNNSAYNFYSDEKAKWNYSALMGQNQGASESQEVHEASIPQPSEISKAAKGGC